MKRLGGQVPDTGETQIGVFLVDVPGTLDPVVRAQKRSACVAQLNFYERIRVHKSL